MGVGGTVGSLAPRWSPKSVACAGLRCTAQQVGKRVLRGRAPAEAGSWAADPRGLSPPAASAEDPARSCAARFGGRSKSE